MELKQENRIGQDHFAELDALNLRQRPTRPTCATDLPHRLVRNTPQQLSPGRLTRRCQTPAIGSGGNASGFCGNWKPLTRDAAGHRKSLQQRFLMSNHDNGHRQHDVALLSRMIAFDGMMILLRSLACRATFRKSASYGGAKQTIRHRERRAAPLRRCSEETGSCPCSRRCSRRFPPHPLRLQRPP